MNTEDNATLANVGKLVLMGIAIMVILIIAANMIG